jgi:4-hydroxybenzoate polyprenyltransferase
VTFSKLGSKMVNRVINWLVYSNIFISLEALFIGLITVILAGFEFALEPIMIAFSSFFIIYNMDRYLGVDEDEENMPSRTRFVRKYGKYFFILSIIGYSLALIIAFERNILTFALALTPVVLSIIYSPLNLKKILFVKNAVVGVSWGTVPLLVGAYYGNILSADILFLSGFFAVSFFRSAMIFDIKDIIGDLKEGVSTIPNKYGIANTKLIAILIDIFLIVSFLSLILIDVLSTEYLIFLVFHSYIIGYVQLLNIERGEYFYSVIIDGECIFIGIIILISSLIGVI